MCKVELLMTRDAARFVMLDERRILMAEGLRPGRDLFIECIQAVVTPMARFLTAVDAVPVGRFPPHRAHTHVSSRVADDFSAHLAVTQRVARPAPALVMNVAEALAIVLVGAVEKSAYTHTLIVREVPDV